MNSDKNPHRGRKFSKEHVEKMSKASKGRKKSPEHCQAVSDGMKALYETGYKNGTTGIKRSAEYKAKISKSLKGNSRANKKITIDGISYESKKNASEILGISLYVLTQKIKNG